MPRKPQDRPARPARPPLTAIREGEVYRFDDAIRFAALSQPTLWRADVIEGNPLKVIKTGQTKFVEGGELLRFLRQRAEYFEKKREDQSAQPLTPHQPLAGGA